MLGMVTPYLPQSVPRSSPKDKFTHILGTKR